MSETLHVSGFKLVEDPLGATSGAARLRRPRWRAHLPLLLGVVLPTLLVGAYSLFMAADRYVAEAQFVVRSPGGAAVSELAGLVQGSTSIRASDEAYIVNAFIGSREAAVTLLDKADILNVMKSGCGDPLWCYPSPLQTHSIEALSLYLQRLISIDYNSTTGVSTLKVQAFRPDDAARIAGVLLDQGEALLNRLNLRAQADAVRLAEGEIALSRQKAGDTLAKLTAFRETAGFIDPLSFGKSFAETISKLAIEAATVRATILELQQTSPSSPQIAAQRMRATALEQQIEHERQKLAGSDSSLATKISDYERLFLEKEFAERRFASALASAEVARLDASRQRVFLERISSPRPPDKAAYPYRLLTIPVAFLIFYAVYSVLGTFIRGALEHADR